MTRDRAGFVVKAGNRFRAAEPGTSHRSRALRWFAIISAVAFVLRLVYLVQARAHDPLFFTPFMDALYHHQWALAVAAGREFIHDAFFRAPLYPYFLGLLYRLFGPNLFVVRVVQAVIGSMSCGLLYLFGRRLFSFARDRAEVIARSAGFALAVYPLAIYYDGELLIAGLLVFLVLLGLVLLLWSRDTDRHWWLPGLVFGLAVIARPNVLLFLAVLPVWFLYESRGRAWKRLALFLGAALLVVLPITVRNFAVSRRFVLVAWQAGTNFYIGNNPESDGATAILPGTRPGWWGGFNDVKLAAEREAGRALAGAEVDRYWLGQGIEFWKAEPGRALVLLVRKLYLWFSGFEVSNDRNIYFFANYTWLGLLVHNWPFFKFPFGLVLPLALAGVVALRRSWRRLLPVYLFVGSYSLSFIVFFVTARFRMPVVPIAVLLAVAGAFELVRNRNRVPALLVLVPALVLLNSDLTGTARTAGNQSQSLMFAATGLSERGQDSEALKLLDRALAHDSAVNILDFKSRLLLRQGAVGEAYADAQAATRLHPSDAIAHSALGRVFAAAGQIDSAEASFRRAVELDPYSSGGWAMLGNTALNRGDTAAAHRYYAKALDVNPGDVLALYHLGLVEQMAGNTGKARALWQTVLRVDPYDKVAGLARQALDRWR